MRDICEVKSCTGCLACVAICPQKCISVNQDDEGFLRPEIDGSKCANCGLCKKKCPANTDLSRRNETEEIKTYSYVNPNKEILMSSASGGAFYALAEYVLKENGVVFGACYNEDFSVSEKHALSKDEIISMCGSKYIECNPEYSYFEVEEMLKKQKTVLFTSTPCRVAGLYAYIGDKKYERLYTAELVCHGVPSEKLFKGYFEYITRKYGEITSYNFRDKSKWGWGSWGSFTYKKREKQKKKHFLVANDYYYSLFFKENTLRESCYICKYASIPRCADIVLGDFWGIDNIDKERSKEKGVSLVITTNSKGKQLVEAACGDAVKETDFNDSVKYNLTVIKPTKRPESRDTFYKDFNTLGFLQSGKKYCKLKHFFPVVSRYIPMGLKQRVKRILVGKLSKK